MILMERFFWEAIFRNFGKTVEEIKRDLKKNKLFKNFDLIGIDLYSVGNKVEEFKNKVTPKGT